MTRVLDMPTPDGTRRDVSGASQQDGLLTTHAPFVPSDMPRDRVFIFGKDTATGVVTVRNPDIETYGTTFDAIIEECFGVRPPISEEPRQDIQRLMESKGLKNNEVSRIANGGAAISPNHFPRTGSRWSWASTGSIASFVKVTSV